MFNFHLQQTRLKTENKRNSDADMQYVPEESRNDNNTANLPSGDLTSDSSTFLYKIGH